MRRSSSLSGSEVVPSVLVGEPSIGASNTSKLDYRQENEKLRRVISLFLDDPESDDRELYKLDEGDANNKAINLAEYFCDLKVDARNLLKEWGVSL